MMRHAQIQAKIENLRVTPAMEAGISDHVWDLEEIIGLLEVTGRG